MTIYGNKVNNVWRARLDYTITENLDNVQVRLTAYLDIPHTSYSSTRAFTGTIGGTGQTSVSGSLASKKRVGTNSWSIVSATFTWNKSAKKQSKTISMNLKGGGESTTSNCSIAISIPALVPVTISFNKNGGAGTDVTPINTYLNYTVELPTPEYTKQGYNLISWNTKSDGSGESYDFGSSYTAQSDVVLYAKWVSDYIEPSFSEVRSYRVSDGASGFNPPLEFNSRGYVGLEIIGGYDYTIESAKVNGLNATTHKVGDKYQVYKYLENLSEDEAHEITVEVKILGVNGERKTFSSVTYISASWTKPVFNRTSRLDRINEVDMNRIANNCAYLGANIGKLVYTSNDINYREDWNTIVEFVQQFDPSITYGSDWQNVNKIEYALHRQHRTTWGDYLDDTWNSISTITWDAMGGR